MAWVLHPLNSQQILAQKNRAEVEIDQDSFVKLPAGTQLLLAPLLQGISPAVPQVSGNRYPRGNAFGI